MFEHRRERTSHEHSLLLERDDHRLHRPLHVHHEEVRVRRDRFVAEGLQVRDRLPAQFDRHLFHLGLALGVLQRRHAAPFHDRVDAPYAVRAHLLDEFSRRDRVAEPHPRECRDLGERPRDDHRASLEDVRHRRGVIAVVHEMMVRLVDQHGHVFRNAVEQLLHFRLRDDAPRRVVRVAEIDESDVAVVFLRHPDERGDVLSVVGEQRHGDRVAPHARRMLVDLRV